MLLSIAAHCAEHWLAGRPCCLCSLSLSATGTSLSQLLWKWWIVLLLESGGGSPSACGGPGPGAPSRSPSATLFVSERLPAEIQHWLHRRSWFHCGCFPLAHSCGGRLLRATVQASKQASEQARGKAQHAVTSPADPCRIPEQNTQASTNAVCLPERCSFPPLPRCLGGSMRRRRGWGREHITLPALPPSPMARHPRGSEDPCTWEHTLG